MRRFREEFAAKGRARVRLAASIEEDGRACVEMEATYVAIK
jgi:hypothetical protein